MVYPHVIPMSGLKEVVMKLFDSKTSSLKINCWGLAKLPVFQDLTWVSCRRRNQALLLMRFAEQTRAEDQVHRPVHMIHIPHRRNHHRLPYQLSTVWQVPIRSLLPLSLTVAAHRIARSNAQTSCPFVEPRAYNWCAHCQGSNQEQQYHLYA